jgi:hypothetical protein
MDAGVWSVVWVIGAAVAGVGLTAAVLMLHRHVDAISGLEFDGGYNALAPYLD